MKSTPATSGRWTMRREGSPWTGLWAVVLKELADHLSSVRMQLLELLIFLTAFAATFVASRQLRATVAEDPFVYLKLFTTQQDPLPSFVAFLGFFLPLAAIALGFVCSVIVRQPATSALAAMAVWLFFALFWDITVQVVAQAFRPAYGGDPFAALAQVRLQLFLSRLSPNTLFAELVIALLNPEVRALGPVFITQLEGAVLNSPLPVGQSLLLAWPQFTGLLAGVLLLFAGSYVLFQRQEVRA